MKIYLESDDATLKVQVTELSIAKTEDGGTAIIANRIYTLGVIPALEVEKPKAEPKKKSGPKPAVATA